MKNLTEELLQRVFYFDIELAEDLKRRMPICETLKSLGNYFRMLLSQYPTDTMLLRSTIVDEVSSDEWFNNFFKFIFPFIKANGMPSYTDTKSIPMYNSTSI